MTSWISNQSGGVCFLVMFYDKVATSKQVMRGRAVVARQAHNLKVVGSNPTPAIVTFILIPKLIK